MPDARIHLLIVFSLSAVHRVLVVLFPSSHRGSLGGLVAITFHEEHTTDVRCCGAVDRFHCGGRVRTASPGRSAAGPAGSRHNRRGRHLKSLRAEFNGHANADAAHRPVVADCEGPVCGGPPQSNRSCSKARINAHSCICRLAADAADRLGRACQLGSQNGSRTGRVQRSWDPSPCSWHPVKNYARLPQPEQECCVRSGILWDSGRCVPAGVASGLERHAASHGVQRARG